MDWVGDLMSHPYAGMPRVAVAQLVAAGTAWVVDGQSSAEAASVRTADFRRVPQGVMGFDERELPTQRHLARRFRSMGCGGVWQRATPHALFSTAPPLVHDLVRFGLGPPATIHVGESEDEVDFLMSGLGPHADLLDRLGRRWRWWSPAGCRPIELLDRMGLLGRQLLLVHGVQFHAADPCGRSGRTARGLREVKSTYWWQVTRARSVVGARWRPRLGNRWACQHARS